MLRMAPGEIVQQKTQMCGSTQFGSLCSLYSCVLNSYMLRAKQSAKCLRPGVCERSGER